MRSAFLSTMHSIFSNNRRRELHKIIPKSAKELRGPVEIMGFRMRLRFGNNLLFVGTRKQN